MHEHVIKCINLTTISSHFALCKNRGAGRSGQWIIGTVKYYNFTSDMFYETAK